LAYASAHDLQEPIRMVSRYIQLIEKKYKDLFDNKGLQYLTYTYEGSVRLQSLVNDIQDYTRVINQNQLFQKTEFDMVIKDAIRKMEHKIKKSKVSVAYSRMPEVVVDRRQMGRLVFELLDNSIKFNASKMPEIKITSTSHNNQWIFRISDKGIGIHPQHHEKVFQVFRRLHKRKDYSGNGIGLALCKRIIQKHDGKIWIESEGNIGSDFCFSLPMTHTYSE